MHYGYTIDPGRQFIFQVFEGHFTVAEIIECAQRLWADPDYATTHNGIVDITKMSPGAVIEDLRPLIAFLKESPKTSQSRWAVIADSPLATAGALVYKTAMSGRHAFEVFSTWESACSYLQIAQPRPPEPTVKITRPDSPVPSPV
jgi:hypothetical protein